jgi:hypothetical protein
VNDLALNSWRVGPDHRAAYRMLARIPSGVTVSAVERFFPHLYERADVWVFPRAVERSDWVLVDAKALARSTPETRDVVERLRVEAEEGSLRLLRRAPD